MAPIPMLVDEQSLWFGRLLEIEIFYGTAIFETPEAPSIGTEYWQWIVKLLLREYQYLHPEETGVCGYV